MTISEALKLSLSVGIYLSAAGIVFGMALENLKVRRTLTEYWVDLATQIEIPDYLRKRTFEIARTIFHAIYHRNGKLSHLRLLYIALTVTGLVLLGFSGTNRIQGSDSSAMDLIRFMYII